MFTFFISRKFYFEYWLKLQLRHWIWTAINGVFQAKRMSHTELPSEAIDKANYTANCHNVILFPELRQQKIEKRVTILPYFKE